MSLRLTTPTKAMECHVRKNWHLVEVPRNAMFGYSAQSYVDNHCVHRYFYPISTVGTSQVWFESAQEAVNIEFLVNRSRPQHWIPVPMCLAEDADWRLRSRNWLLDHTGPSLEQSWPEGKWFWSYNQGFGVWFVDQSTAMEFALRWI